MSFHSMLARRSRWLLLTPILHLAAGSQIARAQAWGSSGITVHALPTGFSLVGSGGNSVNNYGTVIGNYVDPFSRQSIASIFNLNATNPLELGTLGGPTSVGAAINNVGQAVGWADVAPGQHHAFVYSSATGMVDLKTFGGAQSRAHAINDLGQVTGRADISPYQSPGGDAAFLYTPGLGMFDLGTYGGADGVGYGINNAGQITGAMWNPGNAGFDAFLYSGGPIPPPRLPNLGGSWNEGNAINASGTITGTDELPGYSANDVTGLYHAFVYNGAMYQDLGTLGGNQSAGYGVADNGEIVGYTGQSGQLFRAAIWESNGGAYVGYDLNSILGRLGLLGGWTIEHAWGISNNGEFLAVDGQDQNGKYGSFVLQDVATARALSQPPVTATPEPATLPLLLTGLSGMLGLRRRVRGKNR